MSIVDAIDAFGVSAVGLLQSTPEISSSCRAQRTPIAKSSQSHCRGGLPGPDSNCLCSSAFSRCRSGDKCDQRAKMRPFPCYSTHMIGQNCQISGQRKGAPLLSRAEAYFNLALCFFFALRSVLLSFLAFLTIETRNRNKRRAGPTSRRHLIHLQGAGASAPCPAQCQPGFGLLLSKSQDESS